MTQTDHKPDTRHACERVKLSWLPVARIKITREDRSWKGSIGRIGETYVVWSQDERPPVLEGTYKEYGFSAKSFMREDFEVIPLGFTGLRTVIKGIPAAFRSWRFHREMRKFLSKVQP